MPRKKAADKVAEAEARAQAKVAAAVAADEAARLDAGQLAESEQAKVQKALDEGEAAAAKAAEEA